MKSCVICGGGASIIEGINSNLWEHIKGQDIWSLNWAYKTMPYLPSRELFIDTSFFTKSINELWGLWKQGVACYAKAHPKYKYILDIHSLPTTRFSEQYNEKIYIGEKSLCGFFALSLACKEHYDVIYLLGFDFGSLDGTKNTHYYQGKIDVPSAGVGHPELYLTPEAKVSDWEIYLKEPCKIYNVSPKSRIECFDKINYPTFYKLLENK